MVFHRFVTISAACGDTLSGESEVTASLGTTVYSGHQLLSAACPREARTTAFTRYVPGVVGAQAHKAEGPSFAAVSVFPSVTRNAKVRPPTPPCASTFHCTVVISAACGATLSGEREDTVNFGTTAYPGDH